MAGEMNTFRPVCAPLGAVRLKWLPFLRSADAKEIKSLISSYSPGAIVRKTHFFRNF